ncbi:hypothetical protein EON63_17470 [archaeon]|nr:MAG: hypothetical protein EON63_17470 [archaeon]
MPYTIYHTPYTIHHTPYTKYHIPYTKLGAMISLQITARNAATPIPALVLPLTRGELEVVKGLGRYLLPYMLGFDKLV